jgi:hypothetical protein
MRQFHGDTGFRCFNHPSIFAFLQRNTGVRTRGTDAHGTRDRGTAAGSNIYLKENQALIQELQVDPFAEKVIPES